MMPLLVSIKDFEVFGAGLVSARSQVFTIIETAWHWHTKTHPMLNALQGA
jgi:hypothetical protein